MRFDLNRLQNDGNLKRNTAGAAVRTEQLEVIEMCGGDSKVRTVCLPKQPFTRQPHNAPSSELLAPESRGLAQLKIGWRGRQGRFINELPTSRADVSEYQWLQLRLALDFLDKRNDGRSGDFSVRLVDTEGKTSAARISQFPSALIFPPGRSVNVPKVVLSTVRVPLSAFKTVDLKKVKSVELAFDASPAGAILLSDLAFAR